MICHTNFQASAYAACCGHASHSWPVSEHLHLSHHMFSGSLRVIGIRLFVSITANGVFHLLVEVWLGCLPWHPCSFWMCDIEYQGQRCSLRQRSSQTVQSSLHEREYLWQRWLGSFSVLEQYHIWWLDFIWSIHCSWDVWELFVGVLLDADQLHDLLEHPWEQNDIDLVASSNIEKHCVDARKPSPSTPWVAARGSLRTRLHDGERNRVLVRTGQNIQTRSAWNRNNSQFHHGCTASSLQAGEESPQGRSGMVWAVWVSTAGTFFHFFYLFLMDSYLGPGLFIGRMQLIFVIGLILSWYVAILDQNGIFAFASERIEQWGRCSWSFGLICFFLRGFLQARFLTSLPTQHVQWKKASAWNETICVLYFILFWWCFRCHKHEEYYIDIFLYVFQIEVPTIWYIFKGSFRR